MLQISAMMLNLCQVLHFTKMKLPLPFQQEVKLFLASSGWPFNKWITDRRIVCGETFIQVYLRKGNQRFEIDGRHLILDTVELANVCVAEALRGRGLYAQLLALIDACVGDRVFYIENVLDESQSSIYLKRGFTRCKAGGYFISSYYKLPKESKIES